MPLLVAVPWLPAGHGARATGLVELVDVMPTLLELAGVPFHAAAGEPPLGGVSFVPQLAPGAVRGARGTRGGGGGGGSGSARNSSLSVYPRCPTDASRLWYNNWCIQVDRAHFGYMGVSVRVDGWRYTVFAPWDAGKLAPKLPAVRPANGTAGVVEQLYAHPEDTAAATAGAAPLVSDFDQLEVEEVSAQHPDVCERLYAEILRRYPAAAAQSQETRARD